MSIPQRAGDGADPCSAHCPSRAFIELIGDKWTLLVMRAVGEGVHRNGALKRRVEGISQKMLTQTLRALEANGLIVRTDHGSVPPRVDYALTDLGLSLREVLAGIDRWLEDHMGDYLANRCAAARDGQKV